MLVRMRQSRGVELVLVALSAGVGCGGGGGSTLHLEEAAACKPAWQPLSAPQRFDVTSGLVYEGGTVYYSSLNDQAVLAVPTDGSAPMTLASAVTASELWLEGDHLLFTGGDLANQIYSLPLGGGTARLVLDGGAGRTSPGVALAHVVTAGDFYWIEQTRSDSGIGNSTVWHQGRSGGGPAQIGATSFTDPSGFDYPGTAIALGSDTIVIGSAFGQAATLPAGGGYAALLATPTASADMNIESSLAGLDALGAYWSVPGAGDQPGSLMLSPADGGAAKPFFATAPGNGLVQKIWPNPEGGWVMTSLQIFSDGVDHMTIWLVDPQGQATRLACSPGAADSSWIEKGVAVAPDAIYVPAENLTAGTWEIDRVAR